MGLHDTVKLREDLPTSFKDDEFTLTPEMIEKYKNSKISIQNGQIRSYSRYFCKNGSIFDVTGLKIVWGDIAPEDVKDMLGVYYILSEHKSFWKPDETAIKKSYFRRDDPNSKSPFRDLLPDFEPAVFDPSYVKTHAIARIVDGEIQTSKNLICVHYQ